MKKILRFGVAVLAVMLLFVFGVGFLFRGYANPTVRDSIDRPIFTIGDPNYAAALKDGKNVVKFGPLPLGIYSGGMAFDDADVARDYLNRQAVNEGWGVYRLSGDFNLDTYRSAGQTFINKSLLVIADEAFPLDNPAEAE